MYKETKCAVVDGSGTYDWFEVKTSVKQGCCMSGFLFLLVIDWVMRKTTGRENTGIRWHFTSSLEDLDFADDLVLLASKKAHIQTKVNRLSTSGKKTGLKISIKKIVIMKWNASSGVKVRIEGHDIEETETFVYLGAIVTATGGAEEDIKARIGKAQAAFCKLTNVWKSGQFSKHTKLRIFKSSIVPVLLYGCETWRMTKTDEKKLNVFLHKCLRRILKIYWPMRVSNEEIRQQTEIETISEQIRRRRWKLMRDIF